MLVPSEFISLTIFCIIGKCHFFLTEINWLERALIVRLLFERNDYFLLKSLIDAKVSLKTPF